MFEQFEGADRGVCIEARLTVTRKKDKDITEY